MTGLTYHQMRALGPCPAASRAAVRKLGGKKGWVGRRITAREAKDAGISLDDVLWVAERLASRGCDDVARRLRLWGADCAARAAHIYERHAPNDTRVRDAITAVRRYARGKIVVADRDDARAAARAAASSSARAAASSSAWAAAGDAEQDWQYERLVARLEDPEPDDWPLGAPAEPQAA